MYKRHKFFYKATIYHGQGKEMYTNGIIRTRITCGLRLLKWISKDLQIKHPNAEIMIDNITPL